MPLEINRAPVLTLWAAVVAERLGHPADTALTLGRAVAGSAARVKARNIGREERKADRDAEGSGLRPDHVTAPAVLLGKTIRLLPTTDGELRAADGEQPADPAAVQRYGRGEDWGGGVGAGQSPARLCESGIIPPNAPRGEGEMARPWLGRISRIASAVAVIAALVLPWALSASWL